MSLVVCRCNNDVMMDRLQTGPWKPNGRETKVGLHFSGRDSAFTSPVSATKPLTPVSAPPHGAPKEVSRGYRSIYDNIQKNISSIHLCPESCVQPPSSTTPPIDITPPRLKLMRRGTDRKSEFLRGLKDERNGERSSCHSPGAPAEVRALKNIL